MTVERENQLLEAEFEAWYRHTYDERDDFTSFSDTVPLDVARKAFFSAYNLARVHYEATLALDELENLREY